MFSSQIKNVFIRSSKVQVLLMKIFAKATNDEVVLWHRRLGHVNLKNINKLVQGNLVKGLPSKTFKIDIIVVLHCNKGKTTQGFCKKGLKNELSEKPLELLHHGLFGSVSNQLGKFDGKSEEGYLLGYSTSSKGFRVYNRVTRKVQECLHVNFLENQENQKGKGPDWMFDLDLLTPSMNYIPVRKENYADSGDKVSTLGDVEDLDDQQFIVHTAQPLHPEERTAAKEVPLSSEEQALHDELMNLMHQESLAKAHNDNQRIAFEEEKRRISIAKGKTKCQQYFHYKKGIHKESSSLLISGKSTAGVQTRRKLKESTSDQHQALLSFIYKQNRTNHKDQQTCLFACFLSQEEPKKVSQALADESWVEAMQEELLQFKLQDVWVLCDLPEGKRVIGTKWVFRNKRDERGTIIKNKARLVAQGYRQEEGVDYDEVFAPMKCMSKQLQVLKDHDHPKEGLQCCSRQFMAASTPGAWYGKIFLNKFDFRTIKPASTPIEAHKSLGKDEEDFKSLKGLPLHAGPKGYLVTMPGTTMIEDQRQEDVSILEEDQFLAMQEQKLWLYLLLRQNMLQLQVVKNLFSLRQAYSASTSLLRGLFYEPKTIKCGQGRWQEVFDFCSNHRADYSFDDENGVDCFPKQAFWDLSEDFGYEGKLFVLSSVWITPLTPSMLDVVTALAAEENHYSRCQSKHLEEMRGLLDIYALNREVKRLARQTLSQAKQIIKLKKLSKFVQPVVKHHAFWVESQNLKKQKCERMSKEEKCIQSNWGEIKDEGKSDETEESTITPRTLNFEDEAGPSSPLRPIQVMESEEQLKVAEVLVAISRPRGLSIPGSIQTQPQQSSQGTDPKDKGKGILVEEPKKKKLTLQQIRALETTNDEEVARKIQAEWDAEEERKRFEELKKAKPKTTLRVKPTSLAQERNKMMNFLKGQGYKNLQKLKYPQMKELYDKVRESIKDSYKDFIPMGSEKERLWLQERNAKRLSRKRKATISEEQPFKKLKLRTETVDEIRNYLRVVDFEKCAQERESLEGISMITELQVIDSPDGEYLIIHRGNNHFRAFDTLWEILHILDRQDLYHLYRVVQDYYEHIPPTGLGLILLGDLTTIWETPETSGDDFWKNQEDWEIVRWRLNEPSGVHTLELEDGTMIHMLAERRYPLSRELMIRMLEHGMEVEDENETAITLIHLFILWTTEDGDNS
ncbi:putative ribonuclease H-like domain-containing protein [Tanacetum coccineum]